MHECCGSIVLHPQSTGPLPALGDVIAAFHRSGLAIVHLSATLSELTLFVEDDDVDAAMLLVERLTQTLASVAA